MLITPFQLNSIKVMKTFSVLSALLAVFVPMAFSQDVQVYSVGIYAGKETLGQVQLDDSGHTVTRIPVVVNKPGETVAILCTAYDPVVWDISWTEGTKISSVVASGYHGQAVVGIPETTPLQIGTYETGGDFRYFYILGAEDLFSGSSRAKGFFGSAIKRHYFELTENRFVIGEPPGEGVNLLRSDDLSLDDYIDPDRPLAGQAGLDRLAAEGKITLATQADIDAWILAASEPYLQFNEDFRVPSYMRVQRVYLVNEQFTMPNGLYGGHSRSFILNPSMPLPLGDHGHCSFFGSDGTVMGGVAKYLYRDDSGGRLDPQLTSIFGDAPANVRILGVGMYSGQEPLGPGIQLDGSGHEVKQTDVVVNNPDEPVLLLLTCYDPIVWNIGLTEGTELAGVAVIGYHGQAVIGIDDSVPLGISTYVDSQGFSYLNGWEASPSLLTLNRRIHEFTNKDIEHIVLAASESGYFEVGHPLADEDEVVYSDDYTINDYVPDIPPAGQYGLDLLEEAGVIRQATMADIDAWIDQQSEPFQEIAPGIRIRTHLHAILAYVVLDAFEFPSGLYGAHSRTFLLPDGVPEPTGEPGHSRIIRLNVPLEDVMAQEIVDLDDFAVAMFTATETSREELNSGSDSDGDGAGDLIEFAMGTNPLDAGETAKLDVGLTQLNDQSHVIISLSLRSNSPDINAILESSRDGITWNEVREGYDLIDRTALSDEANQIRLRSVEPIDSADNIQLFRLRVVGQ